MEKSDYDFWLDQGAWTKEESCCLLSGFKPSHKFFKSQEYVGYVGATIPKINQIENLLTSDVSAGKLKRDCIKDSGNGYFPKTVIQWALSKKTIKDDIPKPLIEWYKNQQLATESPEAKQPTNQKQQIIHTSELLEIMNHAIADLWENHAPENPPTIDQVEAWFKEKGYNRSQAEIKAIDKIMRPDRYKDGKNKS